MDKGERRREIVAFPQAVEEDRPGSAVDVAQFLHVCTVGSRYAHDGLISRDGKAEGAVGSAPRKNPR